MGYIEKIVSTEKVAQLFNINETVLIEAAVKVDKANQYMSDDRWFDKAANVALFTAIREFCILIGERYQRSDDVAGNVLNFCQSIRLRKEFNVGYLMVAFGKTYEI